MVQIQTVDKQLHFLTKVMSDEITSILKFLHKEYWLHKIGLPQTTKKDKCKKSLVLMYNTLTNTSS